MKLLGKVNFATSDWWTRGSFPVSALDEAHQARPACSSYSPRVSSCIKNNKTYYLLQFHGWDDEESIKRWVCRKECVINRRGGFYRNQMKKKIVHRLRWIEHDSSWLALNILDLPWRVDRVAMLSTRVDFGVPSSIIDLNMQPCHERERCLHKKRKMQKQIWFRFMIVYSVSSAATEVVSTKVTDRRLCSARLIDFFYSL